MTSKNDPSRLAMICFSAKSRLQDGQRSSGKSVATLPWSALHLSRRKPLASCVAAMFALAAPVAFGMTVNVTSCADAFPAPAGSLREAVSLAGEGDTVSMAGLPATGCSTITLHAGEIAIPQNKLTLIGGGGNSPASPKVTIDGTYLLAINRRRIFNHEGFGTLQIENLVIRGGSVYSATQGEYGGCIRSSGNVTLFRSTVEYCQADAKNHPTAGGGVATRGDLTLTYSTIAHNSAGATDGSAAYGGGAQVGGNLYAIYSTVSGNVAGSNGVGAGGGVGALKDATIISSTISANRAGQSFGGIYIKQVANGSTTYITDSTISGNTAVTGIVGGIYSNEPVSLYNSTIAFNTAALGKRSEYHYDSAGLDSVATVSSTSVTLRSSLISNNRYGSIKSDFSIYDAVGKAVTLGGSNNLIMAATFNTPPGLTATTACPLLGPLRNNGGVTQTHALLSHSPAIDQGDNAFATRTYDERGSPYLRKNHVTVDIGAYEVQQEDVVFNSSFDGCP
jgi:hypothetical protein